MPTRNAVQIRRFGGIDRRTPSAVRGNGEEAVCSSWDLCNLRPGSDGSLTRRCGFALKVTLPAAVRGVWSGVFGGVETTLAAAGEYLYQLNLDAGSYTAVGSIAPGNAEGCKVAIFLYRGLIYLLDGESIWSWDGASLASVEGYVPLVSYERHPYDRYTVHEPINLLSRKARFSFAVPGGISNFFFGLKVASVQSVYNETTGMTVSTSYFSLKSNAYGESYISFTQTQTAGHVLLVSVTLDIGYYGYDRIAACTGAVVYGGAYDDRILCYGGQTRSEMFASQPVSALQLAMARFRGAESGDIYFPADGCFRVGDGRHEIRAVCRHYDRLLVFTDGDTWMADFTSSAAKQFPVAPLNSGVGCTSPGGAALAGNDPLTVAGRAVWRWRSSSLRRDECSAVRISAGVEALMGESFASGALVWCDRARGEVWFADPSDEAGQVLVYHEGLDVWYRFCGILADGFFAQGGETGFWRGENFYRFDEARECDLDGEGEHEIPFSLTLDRLDFSRQEAISRLVRMSLATRGAHGALTLQLTTDCGRKREVELAACDGGDSGRECILTRPLRSGRGHTLRLVLSGVGGARFCLTGLTLYAAENPK